MKILGVMNGTSLDGIDIVGCDIQSSDQMRLLMMKSVPFQKELRSKLAEIAKGKGSIEDLAQTHHELGRFYGRILKPLSKGYKAIGIHGQTVYHDGPRATLQIGEMAHVRASTGLPVISNFRPGDLAEGGQGAPIASLFHKQVLAPLALKWLSRQPKTHVPSPLKRSDQRTVAVHNLGGISNLTWIKGEKLLAFDTGPANMLVDLFVQTESKGRLHFDKDGELSSQGTANPKILAELMGHDFFNARPPKSCGREQFGETFLVKSLELLKDESPANIAATLVELTAASVEHAYRKHTSALPGVIVLCGGGAKNSHLVGRMRFRLPECKMITSDELGWPTQSIEGAAFALLAAYRLRERPANLPSTTGARRSALLGQIT